MKTIGQYFVTLLLAIIGKATPQLALSLKKLIGSDLYPLAQVAVADAADLTGLSGKEKQDEARTALVAAAKAAGKDVVNIAQADLNLLLEIAYGEFRAEAGLS